MKVTSLEEVTKSRHKVYLDEQFAFVLYRGELSRYHIVVGQEVTLETYNTIQGEVVQKRAKKRLLHLLEQMPRTEQQLRTKMKQNFYTDEMIDGAIAYAKGFGYIDDKNYVELYIQGKLKSKSRKELLYALLNKGVDKAVIEEVLEGVYEECDESDAIRAIARKKSYTADSSTDKDKQKLFAHLMRKGFSYQSICSALHTHEYE